ncbi:LysE family translocator [Shewanella maritima]|uniref:LysE family translocator n=1 Tax=Shewanella maritima TaxID=2520507 RepID=UPI00373539E3
MDYTLLASLAVIHTIALMSPGPDFAIIVKMATQQTRTCALYCAAGIALAILLHTLLSLLGISLMIQQSPIAYSIVQFVGISYLGWMGIGAFRGGVQQYRSNHQGSGAHSNDLSAQLVAGNATHQATSSTVSPIQGFKIGLLTNLLNPKALVFFITLFTVLVTPSVDNATKIASAIMLFGLSLLWFGFLSIVLSQSHIQRKLMNSSCYIDILVGVIFVGVAITILINLILDVFN